MPRQRSLRRPAYRRKVSNLVLLLTLGATTAWGGEPSIPSTTPEFGGLLITPKRVVFVAPQRSAEVHLMNSGPRETTYRVEFIDTVMDETGRLIQVGDDAPTSLGTLVRFAPRQVTLAPGERQTVRLLLRKPANLAPGEYRSHLRLRAIPRAVETPVPESPGPEPSGFEIRLVALPAISIPVLVRHGPSTAAVQLSDLSIEAHDGAPRLTMLLQRQGDRSVYGDLTVSFLPTTGGEIALAQAKGVAIYPEIAARPVALPLVLPAEASLSSGRVRARFCSRPEADGGGEVLETTSDLEVP